MTLPVTILIPTYCPTHDAVEWFEQCLQSAMKQDCKVAVWDDGSPLKNEVRNVVKAAGFSSFTGTDVNHGPSYARNRTADMAQTELIFPLDCDDVLADGAIAKLYGAWDGTPVFPDLYKFGDKTDPHFRLLDWSCKLQKQKLGIAPVNVLHSKAQWEAIGGWDEAFSRQDIYEDSEYNVRLFYSYCAKNLHLPLVGYRQHAGSRIRQHANDSGVLARQMLQKIGGYSDMACCGKGRKTPSNAPAQQPQVGASIMATSVEQLPGASEGMVWATYVGGKGKLKHYYRGPKTKYPYKVTFMQVLQVDAQDARTKDDPAAKSQFVMIENEQQKPKITRKAHQKPARRSSV